MLNAKELMADEVECLWMESRQTGCNSSRPEFYGPQHLTLKEYLSMPIKPRIG